jgi:hypothetical protein
LRESLDLEDFSRSFSSFPFCTRHDVYHESIKRELNRRLIYECRCDERLKAKAEGSTRLAYTGLRGGLEPLRIGTRLIDERFASVMGECEIVTLKVRHLTPSIFKVIRSAAALARIFSNLGLKLGGERRAAVVELGTGRLRKLSEAAKKRSVSR